MFQGMEYVYEVYKQKSFSKAAAKLYISQPSLSANVKRIERRRWAILFSTAAPSPWNSPNAASSISKRCIRL